MDWVFDRLTSTLQDQNWRSGAAYFGGVISRLINSSTLRQETHEISVNDTRISVSWHHLEESVVTLQLFLERETAPLINEIDDDNDNDGNDDFRMCTNQAIKKFLFNNNLSCWGKRIQKEES